MLAMGMIEKMVKSIHILVVGLLVISFLLGIATWKISEEYSSDDIITGAVTGFAIKTGDLEGLEISVFVPEKYQYVQAGEMLQFQTSIKNIARSGRHDIQLDYYIKKNDIVITHRRELKAVETQASFLSSIKIPEETLPGIYEIDVMINEEESAVATFYVKSSDVGQIKTYLIILIVAILVVGILIFWELHRLVSKLKKR